MTVEDERALAPEPAQQFVPVGPATLAIPARPAPQPEPTLSRGANHWRRWAACLLPVAAFLVVKGAWSFANGRMLECNPGQLQIAACRMVPTFPLPADDPASAVDQTSPQEAAGRPGAANALQRPGPAARPPRLRGTSAEPATRAARLERTKLQVGELSARMYWMSSVVLVVVLAVTTAAMSLLWIRRSLGSGAPVGYGMLAGFGALGLWNAAGAAGNARASVLVAPVFGPRVGFLDENLAQLGLSMAGWVRVINYSSVVFLVLAAAALLYRRTDTTKREELAEQGGRLQILLYVGAGMLIAGLLEYRALYAWAAAGARLAGNGDTAELVASLADASLASTGIVYAIGLAALYLPVLLVLRSRASRLYDPGAADPAEKDVWLRGLNLNFTVPKALVTALTLASPALAQAPIAAILKLFEAAG